ncbi:FxsA family protein [Rhizobium halophilum]|uniref:FxsA family protein n=1 Tax=Rhizobium halophilum TaxID=2846852 RepID=UPI001EFDA314|nr:FxsA family protein [Rhizobium halophilum]MCF6369034.1 membrane protein FxsA [Rhizobium halophilum]
MRARWIFILILLMPLAEIAGFVLVGRAIGIWSTLGLVILTSLVGILLLRAQGFQMLRELSSEGREGRVPGDTIVHGAMIVVAAFLLLIPGFITDTVGLTLFVPAVRRLLWSAVGRRIVVNSTTYSRSYAYEAGFDPNARKGPVVELENEDFQREPNPSSPWNDQRLKDD